MARTKKEVSATAFDAVEETVVENVENQETEVKQEVEEVKETPVEETVVEEKTETPKEAKFYDDEAVKVKSVKRANKKITSNTGRIIEFDSNGIAEVNGIEAKYLLTVPGIELA